MNPWDLFDLNNPETPDGKNFYVCRRCGSLVPSSPPNAPIERNWVLLHCDWHHILESR